MICVVVSRPRLLLMGLNQGALVSTCLCTSTLHILLGGTDISVGILVNTSRNMVVHPPQYTWICLRNPQTI
jgi:hypothetical protein